MFFRRNMASLYRKIFSQSWNIAWRNKYLWFFGLFTLLLAGNGPEMEIFNQLLSSGEEGFLSFWQKLFASLSSSGNIFSNIFGLAKTDPVNFFIALLVLAIILFLTLFMIWLMTVSQVGLINNVALIDAGKENDLRTGVKAGVKNFWQILAYNVINKAAIALIVFILSLPITMALGGQSKGMLMTTYVVLFILFIPLAMIISFIIKYAIAYIVIKGTSFADSARKGWQLFKENWLVSLEMAFSLFFINFASAFVIGLVAIEILLPIKIITDVLYNISNSIAVMVGMLIISLIVVVAVIALCASLLSAFQTTAWTQLFLRLTSSGGTSKLARLVEKIVK